MASSAARYNFTIEQGTTVRFEIQYKDSEQNPVDLTGKWGRMQIRPNYADFVTNIDDDLFVDVSSSIDPDDGTGLYFTGLNHEYPETSGSIGVFISAKKTEQFNFEVARYDLELYEDDQGVSGSIDPRGKIVTRLLEGEITLSREVTR